jgi:peptidoglycan/xylan/chitin deacetylase (PgdA/CDA1 family)
MYHEIYRPEDRRHLDGLTNPAYNTEVSTFQKQMTWLSENNFKTLTIEELFSKDFVADGDRRICLTFDDGWLGNYRNAFPILKEKGFKATFFVATGLIGKPLYMTWDQLKEMHASGMSIQSHSVSHRPLGTLNEKDLTFELLEAKKNIEESLSCEVRHLSIPHGQKSNKLLALATESGYQSLCTSDVGFHVPGTPGPWLKRISVGDGISDKQLHLIAWGKNRSILKMVIIESIKKMLRSVVGNTAYRNLYRWVYGIK